ncbi:hypothetical protein EIP86_011194 [Pleurotus ostreatoroseus]|nr:hypothetical protein EIP86_011194 [Pleurotus ostreatoroseus]
MLADALPLEVQPLPASDSELESTDPENEDMDGTKSPQRFRTFKDTIHGWVTFNERVCKIIDTPHFQRLRNVKQLGTSYYVWPAASHNRFEHCLGVAHLAQEQIKFLQEKQPELGITDEDVDLVTIAGLCHDLGHGPWSHVWDSLFIPIALPDKKWRHEDASEMMFDDLVKLPHVNITPEEATIVKALIAGEPDRCVGMDVKPFLFDIVANKRNGLDVDKFDYIARDNHAIGQGETVSLGKLIRSARVIKKQICYDIKDASTVYELSKAIEYMIIDALLIANKHMHIATQLENPQEYLFLTDDIKTRIEMTKDPELEEARDIFRKISLRQLYKDVDSNVFIWEQKHRCRSYFTPQSIVVHARQACQGTMHDDLAQQLKADHIIVDLAEMHYGMKDANPLDTVRFYSKRRPNKALKAEPGLISHIMPDRFGEVLLRVFTRDRRFEVSIQKGYRALLENFKTDEEALRRLVSSSPEPTEGPSTPLQRSGTLSRVSSAKFSFGGDLTPGGNPFTKFPKGHGMEPQGRRSLSPTPNKVQATKRTRQQDAESPSRKRSKPSK